MEIGFHHFTDCKHIDTVRLNNCVYIDDDALRRLEILANTLKIVEIINCKNVTSAGLMSLVKLENLEKLIVAELPLVHKTSAVEAELRMVLPNCKFDFK
jgi:ATP synthase, H+ transporting, mitochondrial F0 complex, subunit s